MWTRFKKQLVLTIVGLLGVLSVYLIGRRNRKGEVDLQVAEKQLNQTLDKQKALTETLNNLQKQKIDIINDIASEKLSRILIEERNAKKSDQDVIDSLRKRGLVK